MLGLVFLVALAAPAAAQPDLRADFWSVSPSATAGTSLTVYFDFYNDGDVASPEAPVDYYLQDVATAGATVNRLLQRGTVPGMEAGGYFWATVSTAIPADIAAGDYRIKAIVDPDGAVAESDETDNEDVSDSISVSAAPLLPDLAAGDVLVSQPLHARHRVVLSARVSNVSTIDTAMFDTAFALSVDEAYDGNDSTLSSDVVNALPAGQSLQQSASIALPPVEPGTYYILYAVNYSGVVQESDRTNNTTASTAVFIDDHPEAASATDPAADTLAVLPSGSAPGSGASAYLSTDLDVDFYRLPLGSGGEGFVVKLFTPFEQQTSVELYSTDATTVLTSVLGSGITTELFVGTALGNGVYFVAVRHTGGNRTGYYELWVEGPPQVFPELYIQLPPLPPRIPGENLELFAQVCNASPATLPSSPVVEFVLTSAGLGASTLWMELGRVTMEPPAPLGCGYASMSTTLPATLPAAPYLVLARVDADNRIVELSEENNLTTADLVVQDAAAAEAFGDLSIETFSQSGTAELSHTVRLTASVRCQPGTRVQGLFEYRFVISADAAIDVMDAVLREGAEPIPAQTGTVEITWEAELPPLAPGEYRFGLALDPRGELGEADEANNSALSPPSFFDDHADTPLAAGDVRDLILVGQIALASLETTGDVDVFRLSVPAAAEVTVISAGGSSGSNLLELLAPDGVTVVGSSERPAPVNAAVRAVLDPGEYFIRFSDPASSGSGPYTIFTSATERSGPDLEVDFVYASSPARAGDRVLVQASLRNAGNAVAATTSTVDFILRSGSLDVLLARVPVPPIASYEYGYATTTVGLSPGLLAGPYTLVARADSGESLTELREDNNEGTSTLEVMALPGDPFEPNDLPEQAAVLTTSTLTLPLTTDDVDCFAFQAGPGSLARIDLIGDGTNALSFQVLTPDGRTLSPSGYGNARSLVFTASSTAAATHIVRVFVETRYGDPPRTSVYSLDVRVKPASEGPVNLIALSVAAAQPLTGAAPATIDSVVHYDSPGSTHISVDNAVELSIAGSAGPADAGFSLAVLPDALVPGVNRLQSFVFLPPLLPGTYYLHLRVDGNARFPESDETDNFVSSAAPVAGSAPAEDAVDIVAGPVSVSSPLEVGRLTTVSASVTLLATPGQVDSLIIEVAFVLSQDEAIGSLDQLLRSQRVLVTTAGTVVTDEVFPFLAPGHYRLGFIADSFDEVPERDETNNTSSAPPTFLDDHPETAQATLPAIDGLSVLSSEPGWPLTWSGTGASLDAPGDVDFFRLDVTFADAPFRIRTLHAGLALSRLELYASDGVTRLARVDSPFGSDGAMLETTLTPGVFYVAVSHPAGSGAGSYRILVFGPAQSGPDLLAFISHYSDSLFPGEPFPMSFQVTNLGERSAPAGLTAELTLRGDGPLHLVDSVTLGAIPVFASTLVFAGTRVPTVLAPGSYTLQLAADTTNALPERDETNNVFILPAVLLDRPFDPHEPNDSPGSATVLSPATLTAQLGANDADFFRFTAGSGDLVRIDVERLQGEGPISFRVDGPVAAYFPAVSQPARAALAFTASSPSPSGEYVLGVFGSYGTTAPVPYRLTLRVKPASDGKINLSIPAIAAASQVESGSRTLPVRVTVQYTSPGAASVPAAAGLHLSLVSSPRRSADGTGLAYEGLDLPPGSTPIDILAQLPHLFPGNYFLKAQVDDYRQLAEADENDNIAFTPLSVTARPGPADAPDLVASDVTVSASPELGHRVELGARLSYSPGTSAAPGPIVVTFVLSSDDQIDSADYWLGARYVETAASQVVSMPVEVPALTPGNYRFGVLVDSYGAVAERDETNNTSASAVQFLDDHPEVASAANSYPDRLSVNASEPVTAKLEIAGDVDYFFFKVHRGPGQFVARAARGSVGACRLELFDGARRLASGDSLPPSTAAVVQATLPPGTYHLAVRHPFAAGTGSYGISVSGPDQTVPSLLLSPARVPSVASPGDTIPLQYLVLNAGPLASESALPVQATLRGQGTALSLGQSTVGTVAAGQERLVTIDARLPATIATGVYQLEAVLDPAGTALDDDRADNTVSIETRIQPAVRVPGSVWLPNVLLSRYAGVPGGQFTGEVFIQNDTNTPLTNVRVSVTGNPGPLQFDLPAEGVSLAPGEIRRIVFSGKVSDSASTGLKVAQFVPSGDWPFGASMPLFQPALLFFEVEPPVVMPPPVPIAVLTGDGQFGPVSIGKSARATFSIAAMGLATLTVRAVTLDSAAFALDPAPELPLLIPGGASAVLGVRFTPLESGTRSGTLRIECDAPASPVLEAGLVGTGQQPRLDLVSGEDFGPTQQGTFRDGEVVLANTGSAPAVINGFALEAGTWFSFLQLPALPLTLEPGASVSLRLRFAPTDEGGDSAQLYAETAEGQLSWLIRGTRTAPLLDVVWPGPFGTVTVGASATSTFSVGNSGTATLVVSAIGVAGDAFALSEPSASAFTLAPGGRRELALRFVPAVPGSHEGTLTIASNDIVASTLLSGFAVAAPAPAIALEGPSFAGAVTVGGSVTTTVTVRSTGSAPLVLQDVRVQGEGFGLQSTPALPLSIEPGGVFSLRIAFAPVRPGLTTGVVSVFSNAPAATLTMTGAGLAVPLPRLAVSPGRLDFGSLPVRSSRELLLRLSNEGTAALAVSHTGASDSRFELAGSAPFSIPPAAARTMTVVFRPGDAAGAASAVLWIDSNDPAGATTVALAAFASNGAPVAVLAPSGSARRGQQARLDGSGSRDAETPTTSLRFRWSLVNVPPGSLLPDSPFLPNGSPDAIRTAFVPDRKGLYTVRLVVEDGSQASLAAETQVVVANTPPHAAIQAPASIPAGSRVELDAAGSFDADPEDVLTYSWSIVASPVSVAFQPAATGARAGFLAPVSGSYEAALVVSDGVESATARRTIAVSSSAAEDRPPVARAASPSPRRSGPQTIELDATASSDPDPEDSVVAYRWTLSTAPSAAEGMVPATSPRVTYEARVAGAYAFQLTVTDRFGVSASATVSFEILDLAPVAVLDAPESLFLPRQDAPAGLRVFSSVQLDGRLSSDPNGGRLEYSWQIVEAPDRSAGDSRASTLATLEGPGGPAITLTFRTDMVDAGNGLRRLAAAGSYRVRLTVTDPGQLTATAETALVAVDPVMLLPWADAGVDQLFPVTFLDGGGVAPTIPDPTVSPVATATGEPLNLRPFVRLDGHESADPQRLPLTYRWRVGATPAGSSLERLDSGDSPTPTFVPDLPGRYTFELVVSNGQFASRPDRVSIEILSSNHPPAPEAIVEDLNADGSPAVPPMRRAGRFDPILSFVAGAERVVLRADSSVDPDEQDWASLSYRWRQVGGPAVSLSPSEEAAVASFTPAQRGRYAFELTATDSRGLSGRPDRIELLALAAGEPMPGLGLEATADTTSQVGQDTGGEAADGTPRSLRVSLPAVVTLTARPSGLREGQRYRLRWNQLDGPTVVLASSGEDDTLAAASQSQFVPTTSRVHVFEANMELLDASSRQATGVRVSRRIRVVVDSADNRVPVAVARVNLTVVPTNGSAAGRVVTLDGRSSARLLLSEREERALLYNWTQLSGPVVTLANPNAPVTTFLAPALPESRTAVYRFALTVDTSRDRSEPFIVSVQQKGVATAPAAASNLVQLFIGGARLAPAAAVLSEAGTATLTDVVIPLSTPGGATMTLESVQADGARFDPPKVLRSYFLLFAPGGASELVLGPSGPLLLSSVPGAILGVRRSARIVGASPAAASSPAADAASGGGCALGGRAAGAGWAPMLVVLLAIAWRPRRIRPGGMLEDSEGGKSRGGSLPRQ